MNQIEYLREVIGFIVEMSDENATTVREDMRGDNIEAQIQRTVFDSIVVTTFPTEAKQVIDAMRIADIEPRKAATAIMVMNYKSSRHEP